MIRDLGDRVEVSGSMTLPDAAKLFEAGNALLGRAGVVFDLQAVSQIDSSGLAVLFGWERTARRNGNTIRIVNPPQTLLSLADVYGVGDMLPLA
ncbi:MAG: STAS domain-containing protein [Rhodocyclaceae bacterium]|nr:STAS domain-containing protein [Rhodocyclaceae bacterium]